MIRAEIFKVRHHRTPAVIAGLFSLLVLAAPAYLAVRAPASTDVYLDAFTSVFGVVGMLLAAVFGAWVVGHEYRQGTLRRVVGLDARRARLLAVKAGVGLIALVGAALAVAAIGVGATVGVASIHGDALLYDGLIRGIASSVFGMAVVAVVGFAFSVILRSDTYAMLSTLAVMVVFGPLLAAIPTVGPYVPSAVMGQISNWIAGDALTSEISLAAAVTTLVATIGLAAGASVTLFQRRDI